MKRVKLVCCLGIIRRNCWQRLYQLSVPSKLISVSSSIQTFIKQLCSVAERWIIGRRFPYNRSLYWHAESEKRRQIIEKQDGGWGMISLSLHHLSDIALHYFSSFHLKPWCRAFSQQFGNNLISIQDFPFPSRWWTMWALVIKFCSRAMLNSLQYHSLAVSRQGKVIKRSHGSLPRQRREGASGGCGKESTLHLCPPSQAELHLVRFSPLSFSRLWLYWKRLPAGKKSELSIDSQAPFRLKFRIVEVFYWYRLDESDIVRQDFCVLGIRLVPL